jgi:hypothetical protein
MSTTISPEEEGQRQRMHEAAEQYHRLGYALIPIRRRGKEPPQGFKWGEFLSRRPDMSERHAWTVEQGLQLAHHGGPASDNLVTFDIDAAGDRDRADRALAAWIRDCPLVGALPRIRTGAGGFHLHVRSPIPVAYLKMRWYEDTTLEVRSGPHYSLLPPSIHPNGRPYEWERPPWAGVPIIELSTLGVAARQPEERDAAPFREGPPLTPAEVEHLIDLLGPSWTPGRRHDVALAVAGWLADHGTPQSDAWAVIAGLAQQGDDRRQLRRAVNDTYKKAADGVVTVGWTRLVDRDDPLVTPAVAKQLDLLMRGRDPVINFARPEAARERPFMISAADFLTEPEEAEDWLIDQLLRAETITAIVGPPKGFKSYLMLAMLAAVAGGVPALDEFHVAGSQPVGLVQEESGRRYFRRRVRAVLAGYGLAPVATPIYFVTNEHVRFDRPDDVRRVVGAAAERGLRALGLDPMRSLHWLDENSADEMAQLMDLLLRIRDEFRIALLLNHHINKNILARDDGEAMRGSSVIWSSVDAGLFISRANDEHVVRVKAILKEGGQPEPFLVRLAFEGEAKVAFTVLDTSAGPTVDDAAIIAWLAASRWATIEAIAAGLGLSVRQMRNRLKSLIAAGKVMHTLVTGSKSYRYAPAGPTLDD